MARKDHTLLTVAEFLIETEKPPKRRGARALDLVLTRLRNTLVSHPYERISSSTPALHPSSLFPPLKKQKSQAAANATTSQE